jgi:hypothetical protein
MLTIPQTPKADGSELDSITVSEDGDTMNLLLSYIYPWPVTLPLDFDYDILFRTMEAAEKYEIPVVNSRIADELIIRIHQYPIDDNVALLGLQPLTLYAMACYFKNPRFQLEVAKLWYLRESHQEVNRLRQRVERETASSSFPRKLFETITDDDLKDLLLYREPNELEIIDVIEIAGPNETVHG